MKHKLLACMMGVLAVAGWRLELVAAEAFGLKGQGGTKNGQVSQLGTSGGVFEVEGFLRVDGFDLNGDQVGTAAQLSSDLPPSGVTYDFVAAQTDDGADWLLTYRFVNTTSQLFSNLTFLALADAEIGESDNTFFNEYGSLKGVPGSAPGDADQWQIDEPGFHGGALYQNLWLGRLSNSNSVPQTRPEDVALALGFSRKWLWPGNTWEVRVRLSPLGRTAGEFGLVQRDNTDLSSSITLSGQAAPGGISGTVYRDINTNAVPEGGEGIANAMLVLSDTNEVELLRSTTDIGGHYDFGRPPGVRNFLLRVIPSSLPGNLAGAVDHPSPGNDFETRQTLAQTNLVLNWGYAVPTQQFVDATGELRMDFRQWRLNYATGSLLGTLTLTNPASNTATFGPPYQVGLKPATNFYYPHPGGTLPNNLSFVDVSAAVSNQVGGGLLAPGQGVTLTNAVEIYSLKRTAPASTQFEVWAMRH